VKQLIWAAVVAVAVIGGFGAALSAGAAEGRIFVYEFDDETETSAGWVYVNTYCNTTEAGANDGAVVCFALNTAPWAAPEGALPNGSHHSPVAILD
jgi:hypothetical protein